MDNFDGFGAVQSFGSGVGTTGTWRTLPIVEAARRWTRGKEMILKFQGSTCRYSHMHQHSQEELVIPEGDAYNPGGHFPIIPSRLVEPAISLVSWTTKFLNIQLSPWNMIQTLSVIPVESLLPLNLARSDNGVRTWWRLSTCKHSVDPCVATVPFVGRIKPYNGTFCIESMMVVKAEDLVRTSTTAELSAPTLEM